MKILFNSFLIVAAAGIGLTTGFAWRGKSEDVSAPTPVPQAKPSHAFDQGAGILLTDNTPLATKLKHALSTSSGVARWLHWMEAIENATQADFPQLARLAQGNSAALRLIGMRWVDADPRHLFDTIVASSKDRNGFPSRELASVLFTEWPKRDPEAVIAALSGPDDFSRRRDWRMHFIYTSFTENNVERGLRLMSDWRLENYSPSVKDYTKWAAANPRHAAEFTLENPAGYASRVAMQAIGKEWARTDPGRALEYAASKPGELGSTLATAALAEWANRNLTEAAAWLARSDAPTRCRLSPALVESWAKQNASGALEWCESNLAGSSLARAVGGVLKGAAESDVVGAAGLVAAMKPSPARGEAALAVAQKWFPQLAGSIPVAPETITWLAGLDSDSVKRVLDQIQWQWSQSDPKGMAAFVASFGGEQIPAQVYNNAALNMARQNPAKALDWARRSQTFCGQRGLQCLAALPARVRHELADRSPANG